MLNPTIERPIAGDITGVATQIIEKGKEYADTPYDILTANGEVIDIFTPTNEYLDAEVMISLSVLSGTEDHIPDTVEKAFYVFFADKILRTETEEFGNVISDTELYQLFYKMSKYEPYPYN